MSTARDLIIEPTSPLEYEKHLATWYAQGHSDGLGDRLLMFDNTSAPSWELLRFNPLLARDPRFEAALRERVGRLASFHHPAFPVVRPIKELEQEDALAVVSTYTQGMRLAEALKKPRSAAFAVRLIRQLAPALAALQQHGSGIAHGALSADRIVVSSQGRLTIREHMVGSALGSLELPAARLWGQFGILASPSLPAATLDCRTDVIQLGLVVLSLMAGRRIGPEDYPDRVEDLLDEFAGRSGRCDRVIFQPLRYWLERALQLDDYPFESAQDATDALADLSDEPGRADDYLARLGSTVRDGYEVNSLEDEEEGSECQPGPRLISPSRIESPQERSLLTPVVAADTLAIESDGGRLGSEDVPANKHRGAHLIRWAAVGIAVLAVGEAMLIGRLLYARDATPSGAAILIESPLPGANVWVDDRPAGVTPLQLRVGEQTKSIRVLPANVGMQPVWKETEVLTVPEPQTPTKQVDNKRASAMPAVSASPTSGAFRLSSPLEIYVLDGERVLGSSKDGPIVATAGLHEFEFVNSAIGYRERRVVNVIPGQISLLSITLPNGTLNINAIPWAAVWIDGKEFGDTPLGNLSISPGEHEIVFRHPQLGERREKAIVRTNGATRVSVALQ